VSFSSQVIEGQQGMAEGHTGSGEAHDLTDLCSHIRLVAVDGAVGANGFVRTEGTFLDSFYGIISQIFTPVTDPFAAMAIFAVEFDHEANGFGFPVHGIHMNDIEWIPAMAHAVEGTGRTRPESDIMKNRPVTGKGKSLPVISYI